ncbi:MAG: type II secretion system ATPase GspE [Desulfobacterales bacterium]|jgi:general secretion pathway protein E|nr:type II secretion system ATPase GspE [Desulfobacterales bacterium]
MYNSLYQILNERFNVSEEDLIEARRIQTEKGTDFSEILLAKKIVTERQLLEALSIQYDIPFWPELPIEKYRNDFTSHVPIQFLKKFIMVPLIVKTQASDEDKPFNDGGWQTSEREPLKYGSVVVVNDPACLQPMDDLVRMLGYDDIKPVLSTKEAILFAINMSYDLSRGSAEQLVQDMEENGSTIISELEEKADLLDDISDAPIIKLVNHIISQSVKARASDIHIEPYQDSFKVRYRVDGILYDFLTPPKWLQPALISRIKVMANLNIAEKRLPQDGRLDVKIGHQEIDVRVSTLPTSFGERLVLRLLDKSGSLISLSDLGLSSDKLAILNSLIRSPNGIILVTGPTGSGKTTTLYAVLSSINIPDVNIITIEDPIEYQLQGINQIQVNPKIDLTFAKGLRSIVRQDPDVILVGEIRDHETAEIAVQSALTGHLVFSTLHTNDSASAITRLVDIGVEPFLISSSVLAVVAQRLIRVLCKDCKEAYTPDEAALDSLGITRDQLKDTVIYRAKGCENCFHTGYKGRMGIFEMMVLDSGLKSFILKTFDSNQIKNEALNRNMLTLRQDGINKVLSGISTIEEVLRVTQR